MMTTSHSRLATAVQQLLTSVGSVGLAFALRSALSPSIGHASPFLIFTPAVMVAALYAGPIGGAVATLLSAALGGAFFLDRSGESWIVVWDRFGLFVVVGTLISILSVIINRNRQQLAEIVRRERRARAAAEAANQAKDDFMAVVSHELRSPLSIVLGWASLARSGGLSGERLTQALEAIDRNARLQGKLVDDLLDSSRISTGTLKLERHHVELKNLVEAAVAQIRPFANDRGIDLIVDLPSIDAPVFADMARLQQVLTNLLTNALKFTPPGGRVSVTMARTDSHAVVTVTDTGMGIAQSFLPRVFEPFEQDSRTSNASRGGLGLGLSISRHLVEQHGGTIAATSDGPGRGARFTVHLPLDSRRMLKVSTTPRTLAVGVLKKISILVVDDDEDTRMVLAETLTQYGARVTTCDSAARAFTTLSAGRFDLVLCDLRMPGTDGFEFIRSVRSQPDRRMATVPAAAITASMVSDDQDRAIAAGYQLYLQRPIAPEELAAAARALAEPTGQPLN